MPTGPIDRDFRALRGFGGNSEALTGAMDRDFGVSEASTGPIDRDLAALGGASWEL